MARTDERDPVGVLLAAIRGLDYGSDLDGGLTVTRWNTEGNGDYDRDASALFRRLARAALGAYSDAEIGAAVLRELDRRGNGAGT